MLSEALGPTDKTKSGKLEYCLLALGGRWKIGSLFGPSSTTGWVNQSFTPASLGLLGEIEDELPIGPGGNLGWEYFLIGLLLEQGWYSVVFCFSFPDHLFKGNRLFLGAFSLPLLCLLVVPGCRFHQCSIQDRWRQKGNPGNSPPCCSPSPKALSQCDFFPPVRIFLSVFVAFCAEPFSCKRKDLEGMKLFLLAGIRTLKLLFVKICNDVGNA